jgi:hypothetical protein
MTSITEAAAGGSAQAPIAQALMTQAPMTIVTADGDGKLSVAEAARALASARHKPREQEQALEQRQTAASSLAKAGNAGARAIAAEPAQEFSIAASAALEDAGERDPRLGGDEAPPGETESADPAAADLRPDAETGPPSIEPPRSWTKADKELFTSLPRETQERIAERERSREGDFLRRQAEAAEKLKGLTAKEQAAEQARQHYDNALPQLLQHLQAQQAGAFADVRTIEDVERLAREDLPRYLQWDLSRRKIAVAAQEVLAAQQRQTLEQRQRFGEFARREDDLLIGKAPELADPKKVAELQGKAVNVLKGLGFDEAELAASWQGHTHLSLRDHRVQLLIRDATLWRDAQQRAKAAVARPVPPVQRPGVSHPRGAAQDAVIQNLNKQLENASGMNALRTAAKLVAAKRAAR